MNIFTTNQRRSKRSINTSLRTVATRTAITLFTAAALAGCDSDSNTATPINTDTPNASQPLTTDTDQIIRNAAANIARPMQRNYSGLENMTDSVASAPAVDQLLKSISEDSGTTEFDRTTAQADDEDTPDVDIEELLMMFVTSSSGATTDRSDNTITIDPDDNSVCQELLSDSGDTNDLSICTQFISGFDIQIDATTDESGSVSLRFDQQAMANMTYTPDSSSLELRLQGIHTMMQQYLLLENEGGTLPEVMRGAVKLSASITGDSSDSEQASGSVAVTEAIEIIDSAENLSLSLKPSTLMSLQETGASGKMSFHIDGLKFSELIENGDATSTAIAAISIPEFTATVEIQNDDSLKVTRLGFGKGPFSVTIDDAEMIKLTLAQFGFQVDAGSESLTLNDALNFSLAIDNVGGYLSDEMAASFSARLSASAAENTTLLEQTNETIKVTGGGPVTFDYQINDGETNPTGSFNVNAGECFDLADDAETTEERLFEIVTCI